MMSLHKLGQSKLAAVSRDVSREACSDPFPFAFYRLHFAHTNERESCSLFFMDSLKDQHPISQKQFCAPYGGAEIPCYAALLARNPTAGKPHSGKNLQSEANYRSPYFRCRKTSACSMWK